jgi:protocatechuate 3,4-dioxygenase beta subunit
MSNGFLGRLFPIGTTFGNVPGLLQDGVVWKRRRVRVSKPSCVLTPRKDEGPYFIDEQLLRSDITAEPSGEAPQEGVGLELRLLLVRADGDCDPVAGAHVDVWQCNALGIYSDEVREGTSGRKFLRGCQISDASGEVRFTTIIPAGAPPPAVPGEWARRIPSPSLRTRLLLPPA